MSSELSDIMRADKSSVLRLVKTARGQVESVLKMIDDDRYCMDIANQMAAAESLIHRARREVMKAHLDGCVCEAFDSGDPEERSKKLDEILKLLDKCCE